MSVLPRAAAGVAAIAAASVIAACSSSGSPKVETHGSTASVPQTSTAIGSATTSSTTQLATTTPVGRTSGAGSPLSKAAFLSQTNTLCSSVYAKVSKLVTPSDPTDYPALIAYTKSALDLFPPFSRQTKALVARSPDKEELTAKWVALDESDYAAQKPLLNQLLAAAEAKKAADVQRLESALQNTPDHSDAEAKYLTSYGLTECAKLQSL
jgi:hypothetical protein